MGEAGIGAALRRGAPLVDVVVRLRPGVDYADATARLNSLADDFDLDPGHWYGDPALRIGVATKEALERLFGWRLIRVPLERYEEETGTWGVWDGVYRWEEICPPQRFPDAASDFIQSIHMTQPGANDAGQWYE